MNTVERDALRNKLRRQLPDWCNGIKDWLEKALDLMTDDQLNQFSNFAFTYPQQQSRMIQ
jgi:hypothetical protein